jgi:hypothetical protein
VGYVEPEGAVEVGKRRRLKPWQKGPLADNRLWALWQEVIALYPLSRSFLAALSPSSPFRRETSWFWFDVVLGLRSMRPSRTVVARLQTVTDAELEGLIALGEINSRRQEHFFRTLVLAYITVPLTVGAIWAQLSPASLIGLARNEDLAPFWGGTIAGLASAVVVRFITDWRARSFLAVLQMARAERKAVGPNEAAPGA